MHAEGLMITVRPRGILECLDLAVMFCGRRPLPVALAAVIGAVPCMLVNRLYFANASEDAALVAAMVLGVEAAWAAVPLTLYLGQSVFSDRFSWRAAARGFLGGLPALIVFQTILRGICLATVLLAPVAFVGMYYLDQIILLERPALTRLWRRRGAINQGRLGAILMLVSIDALVVTVGTTLGTDFLATISRTWHGRGIAWSAASGNGDIVAALFSWHGQIAFWAACGFLTVFRFFTYLDMRIRREGWDIELRLRAEETYAGLPRRDSSRGRTAVVTILTAALMMSGADTVHAAGGSNMPTTDSNSARTALNRQSFPWYDSAADRYRPLVDPGSTPRADHRQAERSTTVRRGATQRRGGGSGSSTAADDGRDASSSPPIANPPADSMSPKLIGGLGWAIVTASLVAAVVGLIALLIRHGLGERRHDEDGNAVERVDTGESHADVSLPAGIRLADGDLLARASAIAEQGDYSAAIIFYQAWMLTELDRKAALVLAPGKTTGQYRAEVAATAPGIADLFGMSCRLFEDAFFGRLAIERTAFQEVWGRRGEFSTAVSGAHPP